MAVNSRLAHLLLALALLSLSFSCARAQLPALPPSKKALLAADAILHPMPIAQFYSEHYREHILHYSTATGGAGAPPFPFPAGAGTFPAQSPSVSSSPPAHPFAFKSTEAMLAAVAAHYETFRAAPKGVRLHVDEEKRDASELDGLPWREVEHKLQHERYSLVLQAEHLGDGVPDPLQMTQKALEPLVEVLGANRYAASAHYYLSGRNAHALAAHDDRYDVVVLHMAGEKNWTTCVPKPTPSLPASLTDADSALLWITRAAQGWLGGVGDRRSGQSESGSGLPLLWFAVRPSCGGAFGCHSPSQGRCGTLVTARRSLSPS
jgi:hypothetical protein